jgi:hypothetical protein
MAEGESASPTVPPRGRAFALVLTACVLVQTALGLDAARQWTPTHDEYWHLPYGLHYWRTGNLRADPINPPLVRVWAAIPLVLHGALLPPSAGTPTPYEIGDSFRESNAVNYRRLFFCGRVMILFVGLSAGITLALWARAWFGGAGGMIAAVLWFGCPTLLANSIVVTHDLPLAAGVVAVLAATAWFRHAPSWKAALVCGVLLGLAQQTKLTAVLLYPLVPLFWLVLPPGPRAVSLVKAAGQWAAALVLSWVVLAASYGFQDVGLAPTNDAPALSTTAGLRELSCLLPGPYRLAWQRVASDLRNPHPVFLNGEWREGGYPTYYLWALAYKLPLGTLLLMTLGLLAVCRRESSWNNRRMTLALLLVAAGFLVPASRSPNQIGLRYILPAFPCLILLAAQSAAWCDRQRTPRMAWLVLLATLSVPLALRFHPHHLTYFNELAGGPIGGRQHLVDSNLDWGQDLYKLMAALNDQTGDEPVSIAYFGSVPPYAAGLAGDPPPQFSPQPGWHAVSVNFVQGRPHTLRRLDGRFDPRGLDAYGYFRFFTPRFRVGNSIDVFYLSREDVARFQAARAAAG